jgi:hypothetical protein
LRWDNQEELLKDAKQAEMVDAIISPVPTLENLRACLSELFL